MTNGFFQLIHNVHGTSIKIVPPTNGGEMFPITELTDYLNARNIRFDLHKLNAICLNLKEKVEIPLSLEMGYRESEKCIVTISADKMSATMRFHAPSNDGDTMSGSEILQELKHRGVHFGIKEEVVEQFVEHREYCKDFLVAEGQEPIQGCDASIEYFFSTDIHAKPTLLEDGSVDFFNLNTINHCNKGDLLARLTPAVQGKNGTTVTGENLKPREVRRMMLHYGRNISISEDKNCIYSEVNGHVVLVEEKVFVSDVLELENVDMSTGNIEYEGSVLVRGNVCSNFSVISHGNIEVRGIVEGAYLEADGDIIIARGMNGMGKGELKAGGNIVVKFMENVNAEAQGYVSAETILHSHVSAGTDVTVTGRKGFIAGGRVCATHSINVKTLGSAMGADTIVEVGVDPGLKNKFQQYQKDVVDARSELDRIEGVIASAKKRLVTHSPINEEQAKFIATSILRKADLIREITTKETKLEEMQDLMEGKKVAQIIVTGEVYPGTKICISEVSMVVKSVCQYCRFVKVRGDVKMEAI
ncbi:MAG: DUF342 domain-containing protein [Lachnospiraceae bacterium]|nr:DUF342 domain-containing protein [Lachnospiraceae bacterium]